MGLGAAYKEGFRHILEKFDSELIVQMDADHSHQPEEIPNMLEKIKNFDFLVASRHVEGSDVIGWGIRRKMTHSVAGTIASACAKIEIKDSTSGFRMFKKKTLEKINFDRYTIRWFCISSGSFASIKTVRYEGIRSTNYFHKQNRR